MYKVDISPAANSVLEEYTFRCVIDNGTEYALRLLDAFDSKVSFLESTPMLGCTRLKYIPSKYRVINFGAHLWLVYQNFYLIQKNCSEVTFNIACLFPR